MVLSNKKLKQKLRAELAKSLAESQSKSPSQAGRDLRSKPIEGPRNESLRSLLLDSTNKKPRLSKREKRRKIKSLRGESETGEEEEVGTEEIGDFEGGEEEGGKKKKRKSGEDNGDESLGGEEGGDGMKKDGNKKKNKKKKKEKKNKGKKGNGEGSDEKEKSGVLKEESKNGVENDVMQVNGQETEDVAKKVYVGGIPYYSTEDDIRSFFEGCGTITEIDCLTFPETESGKFRGIAMISFKTEAAAKRALALDGSDMGGLVLKIKAYKSSRTNKSSDFVPPVVDGYNRIYVGNLSWDITEDDLKKFFSKCSISSIRFGMDKETGEFRGYAHVDFSDNLSMTKALKLDQQILCGRPVKIMRAIPNSNVKSKPAAVPISTDIVADETAPAVVSGKVKRRKCLICGEKGHLSYSCPKKPADSGA